MALKRLRLAGVLLAACAAVAALAYLRDPPWLAGTTSGLSGWTTGAGGTRYRWAGSHASFFVPADARGIVIPVRATFDSPQDWPVAVEVTLDDRAVDRLTLRDAEWRPIEIRMPPPGSRRHRRVDIRLDRTRAPDRGIQIGDIVRK